jgi:hypothetical protein
MWLLAAGSWQSSKRVTVFKALFLEDDCLIHLARCYHRRLMSSIWLLAAGIRHSSKRIIVFEALILDDA